MLDGVRLSEDECRGVRLLVVDAQLGVIAASDGRGVLAERIELVHGDMPHGHYVDAAGRTVAFARTPGYESYRGMGWYGVVCEDPAGLPQAAPASASRLQSAAPAAPA